MKLPLKKLSILLILVSIFPGILINAQFLKGNGNITKSDRKITSFKYVEIEDGIDLYITQSDNFTLSIEADQNLHQYIVTENKGDILKIYLSKSIFKSKSLKAFLNVMDLKGVDASGGSDVYFTEMMKLDDFSAICSGGSDIEIDIETNLLKVKVSGGSDVIISGQAKIFNAMISGGSDIKAFKLETTECNIEAKGGSDAEVNTNGKLFVKASGGSDIRLKGNPASIDSNMSGGSSLIRD